MSRLLRGWLLAALTLLPLWASAHEMSMAEMQIRETAPNEFLWMWTASGMRPASDELTPVWPKACVVRQLNTLRCDDTGLNGELSVEGVGKSYSAAMVKVFWLDGGTRVYTFTSAQPTVQVFGSAEDNRGMGQIAKAYTVLGFEHILSGFDHLTFVVALLFLVGFNRRLVLTITAFTAAHSLTLALSALGLLTLRPPPVEATIALSIMLVASEALSKEQTLSRRWPAVVAFLFGLVHGLGFAGALKDIGLPENHLAVALLTFNVGVELGQLFVVGLIFAAFQLFSRIDSLKPGMEHARVPALYVIGAVAAYWSIDRVVGIVVG